MITRIVIAGTDYAIGSLQLDTPPNTGDHITYRVDDRIQSCAIALALKVTARTWNLSDSNRCNPELVLYVISVNPETNEYVKAELLRASKKRKQQEGKIE